MAIDRKEGFELVPEVVTQEDYTGVSNNEGPVQMEAQSVTNELRMVQKPRFSGVVGPDGVVIDRSRLLAAVGEGSSRASKISVNDGAPRGRSVDGGRISPKR